MDNFRVRHGEGLAVAATLTDDQGDPITTYTGSEPLTAMAWPGGDFPASFSPTVTWITPGAGIIKVACSAAQISTLAEARYFGTVSLLDPTLGPLEAYQWSMDVSPAAGSATTGLLYCTTANLIRFGRAWFKKLLASDEGGGFQEEIDGASRRLDDLIIARYPTNNYVILGDPGYGSLIYGNNPGALPNQWLRGILAVPGGLIVRPKVIECVAKWALAEIAKGQVGIGDSAMQYRILGNRYETEASAVAMTMTAEICTNSPPDGTPSFGVPLGGTSMRPFLC